MAGAIVVLLFLASLVLAWLSVRGGGIQDGWELVPFILFPLIAAMIASIRLRGFLPDDPRPLRVHRALREDGGLVVLASFVAQEGDLESRTLARLRFDGEGNLRHLALADLPPLERPPGTVDTFLREAQPLADGGLALVLQHAAPYGAATSREYRIRLAPAGSR